MESSVVVNKYQGAVVGIKVEAEQAVIDYIQSDYPDSPSYLSEFKNALRTCIDVALYCFSILSKTADRYLDTDLPYYFGVSYRGSLQSAMRSSTRAVATHSTVSAAP